MKVSHFGGTVDCKKFNDLNFILNIKYGSRVNEFWISGEDDYPCLVILVNNDYANITYFPEDGHPGFQSIGMGTDLSPGGVTIFYTNTPNEEIEIRNDTIVPFPKAMEAAKEYFFHLLCLVV
jgi:hypothetical protein